MLAAEVFKACVAAMDAGALIEREGRTDKEFHFQNWFKARLDAMGAHYDSPGRNAYPDFRLTQHPEGYELKGLAYPGREASYDSNSQVPCGEHNGMQIFYVFGRYPADPDGNSYPVLDLVMCHGSFLNADSAYVHQNKSFRGFGSYGDLLVRDRKMYVAPTPFHIVDGAAHQRTLILPADTPVAEGLSRIATVVRTEVAQLVASYSFDLRTNELEAGLVPNPNAGREHRFSAYRVDGDDASPIALREASPG